MQYLSVLYTTSVPITDFKLMTGFTGMHSFRSLGNLSSAPDNSVNWKVTYSSVGKTWGGGGGGGGGKGGVGGGEKRGPQKKILKLTESRERERERERERVAYKNIGA